MSPWSRVRIPWFLSVVLALALLQSCARPEAPARRTFEFSGPTMGAAFSVQVVTGPEGLDAAGEVDRLIRRELEHLNALMSTWDPDSELSRFNAFSETSPFPVSPETFEAFQWAKALEAETGGAFDVTVAPLIDAWGFGPDGQRDRFPTDEEIARLRQQIGMRHLELDAEASTVRKTSPDLRCEFSAFVPGYAADRLWALLVDRGFSDFLIDVGGELRTRGVNDEGRPWQIAIERPQSVGRAIGRLLAITDLAIATSGDYRNYYEVDGQRVVHILDPRDGRPIRHRLASVTVIDELAVRADGLSTALMVLGPEEGLRLARQLDLPALFIVRTDEGFMELTSPRFDALFSGTSGGP
jgi:thiamine biosynthesis lipoprotein